MGNYIGKHQQGADSLFDAMVADMFRDKEIRTEKFMRTHYVRNDGKPQKKDKRKANFSRKVSYFDRDLDDRRPNYGKAMEGTIRRYRADMDTMIAIADYEAEQNPHEHYVGETTLQKLIDRKYAELNNTKAEFCREHGCHSAGDYAVTDEFHFIVFYPQKIVELQWELDQLRSAQERKYRQKLNKGA